MRANCCWRTPAQRSALPPDSRWDIAQRFNNVTAQFGGLSPDPLTFEGYLDGRLVVEVLKGIASPNITRAMFRDQVYNTRMFVLDDLILGLYSRTCYRACCPLTPPQTLPSGKQLFLPHSTSSVLPPCLFPRD